MSPDLNFYKLSYAGKAIKISEQNIIQNFTLFDILLISNPVQRRLYIWMGKKASQNLKNHIPRVREILSEHEPNLIILRNITMESGFENNEFLESIGISGDKLQRHIRTLETRLLPLLSELNRLKEKVDNAFVSENYEEAIELAQEVKKIANQLSDTTLEQDQDNLIAVAKSKYQENELFSKIELEAKANIDEFNQLIKIQYFQAAHKIVQEFRHKYEKDYNLSLIPTAQQLLLKDENIKYSLKYKEEGIRKRLSDLEGKFVSAIKEKDLHEAKSSISVAKKELIKVIDEEIIKKWQQNEEKLISLQEAKLQEIFQLSTVAIEHIDRGEFDKALNEYKTIIKDLKIFK